MHARADGFCLFQSLLLLLGRRLRIERADERQEHLAQRQRSAHLVADVALALQGHDGETARHLTGLLIAPTGISATSRATSGSSWFACTQPNSPPCSAVWFWLNCAATTGNAAPLRSSAITVSAKRSRVSGGGGILHRNENLAHPIFRLANLLRQDPLPLRDFGVADIHLLAKLLAQHLAPAELRANLIDQRYAG